MTDDDTAQVARQKDLVARFLSGERSAFDAIYAHCAPAMHGAIRRVLPPGRGIDPADIFEDAWADLLDRSLRAFQWRSSLRTFTASVAANKANDALRRRGRSPLTPGEPDDVPVTDDPMRTLIAAEDRAIVLDALGRLTPECRRMLEMRFVQELKPRDIAAALKAGGDVVRQQIHRCTQRLLGLVLARYPELGA